jgi:hypothetical protein
MIRAGYVALWGRGRCVQGFGGKTYHLENIGIVGRIILKWIFRE